MSAGTAETGWLAVVGTGPGPDRWLTPETAALVAAATDLVGYGPYVARVGGAHHRRHGSDNREELARAAHALDLAASGARVVVVSGGDPGIFGMAAAIWEATERAAHDRWHGVAIHIAPAVSAIQAVAAAAGAPLGNDFCVISLSDNLKPWSLIAQRVEAAGLGDFAVAFYNPISRARPWQLGQAMQILAAHRTPHTPVVVGTAIGRGDQQLTLTDMSAFSPDQADMRTLVIVGNSTTRQLAAPDGRQRVYTPRCHPADF
ncbi:precorrin-3B C(17)-methyltransferase [Salinisphaera sp. Q1T1-3]|uniref:precorrin-3B C(17)-methyltransferase n=1 Tax=Salinisphaera sp. Q1T1-3 TaxID=2321229 RepID=UPI000E73CE01|nr:precorrin-3B C(17)-methyltransferase [Salinisphaera sp. Q1T1-3]RJS95111.1 precorrin-3B C(17)-methyltransferase [Salinisphaera sp. Q1T1-3]